MGTNTQGALCRTMAWAGGTLMHGCAQMHACTAGDKRQYCRCDGCSSSSPADTHPPLLPLAAVALRAAAAPWRWRCCHWHWQLSGLATAHAAPSKSRPSSHRSSLQMPQSPLRVLAGSGCVAHGRQGSAALAQMCRQLGAGAPASVRCCRRGQRRGRAGRRRGSGSRGGLQEARGKQPAQAQARSVSWRRRRRGALEDQRAAGAPPDVWRSGPHRPITLSQTPPAAAGRQVLRGQAACRPEAWLSAPSSA